MCCYSIVVYSICFGIWSAWNKYCFDGILIFPESPVIQMLEAKEFLHGKLAFCEFGCFTTLRVV
jgi:hypothetical protein